MLVSVDVGWSPTLAIEDITEMAVRLIEWVGGEVCHLFMRLPDNPCRHFAAQVGGRNNPAFNQY